MELNYLSNILEIANVFISLFVLGFALIFLKKTQNGKDRKPWFFLFFAIVIFLVFEILAALHLFAGELMPQLAYFLKTLFIGLILYVFVYQYYLITMSKRVVIMRKDTKKHSK